MTKRELEQKLDSVKQMLAEGKKEEVDEILASLKTHFMFVPAMMPSNTPPEVLRQMISAQGKNQPLPKGANPQPCILENAEKQKFLAVFTSEEHLEKKGAPKFPLTLNVPFEACTKMLQSNKALEGIVINPYTQNIIFRLNQEKKEKPKKVQVTVAQYHAMKRQELESFRLPKMLFEKKAEIKEMLCEKRGEALKEIYDALYDDEIANPYTAEDFDVMPLGITKHLTVMQITMPKKNFGPNMCRMIVAAYDSQKEAVWYYAVVFVSSEEGEKLVELTEDGNIKQLGEAPKEGNELSTILELIQK